MGILTEPIYETTDIIRDGKVIGSSSVVIENRPVEPERIVHGNPEPVIFEQEVNGEKSWYVHFDWSRVAQVDRPDTGGYGVGPGPKGKAFADRLARATRAGVLHYDAYIRTDNAGQTFVSSSTRVTGRYMNADLKRLGF